MKLLVKMSMMLLGFMLMAFGVLIAPLPGPLGVPFFIGGLILVLRNSTWAKRQFIGLRRRYPKLLGPVRSLLRPGAKVVSLMWLSMLRTERHFLRQRKDRFLYRCRRTMQSWFGQRRPAFG